MRHQPTEPAVLHARIPHSQGGSRRPQLPEGAPKDPLLMNSRDAYNVMTVSELGLGAYIGNRFHHFKYISLPMVPPG